MAGLAFSWLRRRGSAELTLAATRQEKVWRTAMLTEENENLLYEILEDQSSSTQKVSPKGSLLARGTHSSQLTGRCLGSCFFGNKVLGHRNVPFSKGKELQRKGVPASQLRSCGALAIRVKQLAAHSALRCFCWEPAMGGTGS